MTSNIPQLRLSYNTLNVWNTCRRRFFLQRYVPGDDSIEEGNWDLSFGKAVEAGIVSLLETEGDIDQARVATLLGYEPYIETPEEYKYKYPKRLETAVLCVERFAESWNFQRWKLLASQISFKIIINTDGDYYCGFIDAVLHDVRHNKLVVGECKTTAMMLQDVSVLYANSSQGLGYSVVLDSIVNERNMGEVHDFISLYLVSQLWRGELLPRIHTLPFPKTKLQRLDWLMELHEQTEEIKKAFKMTLFRKNGEACYKFGRPCQFFGVCDAHGIYDRIIGHEDKEENWDYVYQYDDLVRQQVR